MDWTDPELDELAVFLAKRMRPDLTLLCADDAPEAGDPVQAWRAALRDARDRGAIGGLMARAAAAAPHDVNLQQACGILRDPAPPRPLRVVLAAALVGFVVVLGGGGAVAGAAVLGSGRVDEAAPAAPVAAAPAQVAAPQVAVDGASEVADPSPTAATPADDVVVAAADGVDAEVELAAAPVAVEAPAAPPTVAPVAPVAPTRVADARCGGRPGEVVGYWYAGERSPGKVGQQLTLDQSVNVRATYPDEQNRFDKRSEVRCVLSEGDQVLLAQAPIRVPGGHWWVPLVVGPTGT